MSTCRTQPDLWTDRSQRLKNWIGHFRNRLYAVHSLANPFTCVSIPERELFTLTTSGLLKLYHPCHRNSDSTLRANNSFKHFHRRTRIESCSFQYSKTMCSFLWCKRFRGLNDTNENWPKWLLTFFIGVQIMFKPMVTKKNNAQFRNETPMIQNSITVQSFCVMKCFKRVVWTNFVRPNFDDRISQEWSFKILNFDWSNFDGPNFDL